MDGQFFLKSTKLLSYEYVQRGARGVQLGGSELRERISTIGVSLTELEMRNFASDFEDL